VRLVGDPTLLSGGLISRNRIELYGFGVGLGFGIPCKWEAGGDGGSESGSGVPLVTQREWRDGTGRDETTRNPYLA
jgi:hypothetical protein